MSPINKLKLIQLREGYKHILITIEDKNYLTNEMAEEAAINFLHPFCSEAKDDLICNFEPGIDEDNMIYMHCKECNVKRHFSKILLFDAVISDGKTIMLDIPPRAPLVSLKNVLKKSEFYQESLVKEETLFQFLKRKIRRLLK